MWEPTPKPTSEYSTIKFPSFALELVRGDCSSSLGAALGNALLHDIRHLLKPDVDLRHIIMDKAKLDRAKAKIKVIGDKLQAAEKSNCICLGVDSKIDENTLTYEEVQSDDGSTFLRKTKKAEHHLTFTYENGFSSGEYLTHRTIPVVGATGQVLANETLSVIEEYGSRDSLKAILVDNTSVNTGWKGGLVVKLEELLNRKLHMIGCALHQNELPFKAIFKKLDGGTTGPRSFSGILGKKCKENNHELPQVSFNKIETPIGEDYISAAVLNDLSSDQRLLFEYCKGIGSGRVDDQWASWKIGPLNHARWLTLAIRILCVYSRETKPTPTLKQLVYFIVQVYAPTWFEIKKSSKFHESPKILFDCIQRIKQLPFEDIKHTALENIQRNAFCLLPDNFVYAMIKDDEPTMRNIALKLILASRKGWVTTYILDCCLI